MTASVELERIALVFNGKTPAKSDQRSKGHPVLKIRDIDEDGQFRGPYESFVELRFAERFPDRVVRTGDTLILNAAHNAEYVASKVALAGSEVAGALATGEWLVIRPIDADARFVHYWIRSSAVRRTLRNLVKGIHLYPKDVARLLIPTPPIAEQRRIADILAKADAIRCKRKEITGLTAALLRSAFVEMFGDPVTNSRGWPVKPLAELGRITTGNTPSRAVSNYFGNEIEWIKSDNINTPSHFLTRATEGLSAAGLAVGRAAPAGSTLMTCIAGSPDCIGNVALADRVVAFNQQINAVTPHGGVDHRFLYVMLLVGKRLVQAASTDSMKGMVSKGKLEQVLVPSPPSSLQTQFGETFERVRSLSRRHELAEQAAQRLFASVVARAFSGELELC